MCILFIYTNPNPKPNGYRLIIASNRDEILKRPARNIHVWEEDSDIIGGRDDEQGREGGTWFSLSTKAMSGGSYLRVGCLLNVTGEPRLHQGRGRGSIVTDYLQSPTTAPEYIELLKQNSKEFNAFNFVAIEVANNLAKTYVYSNVDNICAEMSSDLCLGLGNSLSTAPFKKVQDGEDRFRDIVGTYSKVSEKDKLVEELFFLLKWEDRHLPDPELENRAADWLDNLSCIFVSIPSAAYGTRAHSIVLVDDKGNIDFLEDSMQQPIQVEQPVWRLKKITSHL